MATPQKAPLRAVTAEERVALAALAKASSERLDRVRRARALLAVADGQPFARAAERAGLRTGTAVANLVERFNERGLAALAIAPGRGCKPTYDGAARARIVATVQAPPDREADGTATWSLSTLERRLRREAFPRVGATTVRRVLEAAGSSYQKTRTWCPTGTAQRKRKTGVVTVVDPQTEEKRGASSRRTGEQRRPGFRSGAKTRRGRTRRSRSRERAGRRSGSRPGGRTSTSGAGRPSC